MIPIELSIETFFGRYGIWMGLVVYILLKDVIPFAKEKWLPAQMQAAEDDRKSKAAAEDDERKWLRNMFAAQVQALQAIEKNLVQINADNTAIRDAEGMITDNQTMIMQKQDTHHNEMMNAVSQMRERTARIDGIAEGKKMPKTGPLEEKKP
jgi:hypothetical protein